MIIPPLIVVGLAILLCVNSLVYLKTVYKTHFRLHLVLVPGTIVMAVPLFWLFAYRSHSDLLVSGAIFFAVHCAGLPFVVAWGESFTKRLKAIAARGDFQMGLPAPSKGYMMLAMFGQLLQDLSKGIIAVEGTEKINTELRRIGQRHPILLHTSFSADGQFKIDEHVVRLMQGGDPQLEGFIQVLDYIVQLNLGYLQKSSPAEIGPILQSKAARTLAKYRELLIQENLLERLADGAFSDRASTGFLDFDRATGGGIAKGTVTLVCAPPSDERETFIRRFLLQGLKQGQKSIYVSSARPPRELLASIGRQHTYNLMIVDCYTNRVAEVPSIVQEGNIVTTPVELSVVKVAISRVTDKSPETPKRAIVDVLPTYLVFTTVEKIYLDLLEIIDDLKKCGYTTVFSLNPYVLSEEKSVLTLEEMFDNVIHVERIPDEERLVSKRKMLIRVDKMAQTTLTRKDIEVDIAPAEDNRLMAPSGSSSLVDDEIPSLA